MIDREKLIALMIEAKKAYTEDVLFSKFLADFLIANGVTFATDTNDGGEWINVEDKLPVDVKPVLAYYGFRNGDGVGLGTMFTGPLSYFGYSQNPHWQHESTGLVVTHWMPLPEPPKEE